MQLLVSVRSEAEVAAALAGGADLIDAKEPALGSLGPVGGAKLLAIAARVPETVPLSAALGDFRSPGAVRLAVAGVSLRPRRAASYVKLGFAGERSEAQVASLIAAALEAAASVPAAPVVVPVAYADHERAGSRPGPAAPGPAAGPAPICCMRGRSHAGAHRPPIGRTRGRPAWRPPPEAPTRQQPEELGTPPQGA